MQSVDIVVLGAGVVGASIAWHLAKRGHTDVLVLDPTPRLGMGSTGRATGGFRLTFGSEVNVRLSQLARPQLVNFADELGVDPGFEPRGYLYLAESEEQLGRVRDVLALQQAYGVKATREVTLGEIAELNPAANLDGVVGGLFGADDAFLRPLSILQGYYMGAEQLGVEFRFGTQVEHFTMDGNRITEVAGIGVDRVVNAAGAWAKLPAGLAGVDIRVEPMRRQAAVTMPTTVLPPEMPMTIFLGDGFHLRVRDGRVFLLQPGEPVPEDPFDTNFDASWFDRLLPRAHACMPCLRDVKIDVEHCVAGLYEMSPDEHALFGRAPGVENLFLANGSSGHGVMHSPALGQLMAELLLDGEVTSMDVHALRPERFEEGEANDGVELL